MDEPMMEKIAFPSTGNDAKDEEIAQRYQASSEKIAAGICPNGCGGLHHIDANNAECGKCGFTYFSSGGLNFKYGTVQ